MNKIEQIHPDDAAVDRFAAAMKAKLAEARAKGRSGWDDKSDCTQQTLSDMLRAHVEKGDPRDVANFCMFLHQRGESIDADLRAREQGVTDAMVDRSFKAMDDVFAELRPDLTRAMSEEDTLTAKKGVRAALIAAGLGVTDVPDGMQPSRPKPPMPVGLLGPEDFCLCNNEVSLQIVSGGRSPYGYLGRVRLKIKGEYVDYLRAPIAAAPSPEVKS